MIATASLLGACYRGRARWLGLEDDLERQRFTSRTQLAATRVEACR